MRGLSALEARLELGAQVITGEEQRRWFRGPEFSGLHQALYSWVAGATEPWQIPEADLAGMTSFTEDEEMYERAKELRDQVHRDGVRIDELVDVIVDCDSGAELFARVR